CYILDWDAKFHYQFWRPLTAIRNGDQDGNDATERDAGWLPLNATPMHPEYPSQAGINAGTARNILESVFGTGPESFAVTDVADARLQRRFDSLAPRLLWGRRHQDAAASLKDTNLTQFAPDVFAGLYVSLFMFSGEHSVEYVERERMYLIRLKSAFRNRLPPGQFPYPFWHDEAKWGVYQATNCILPWVNPKTARIVI